MVLVEITQNNPSQSKNISLNTTGQLSQYQLFLWLTGMNAAIRAVVRMGLYAGARVFTVWEVCKITK